MRRTIPILSLLACLAPGCGESEPAVEPVPVSELPERFLLPEEPEGALDVSEARAAAVQGEHIVVRGLVGGSRTPFVNGLAAFTLVDAGLVNTCTRPDDPLRDGLDLLPTGARGFHGLDQLSEVVVAGRAEPGARGNVTVVATGLHLP